MSGDPTEPGAEVEPEAAAEEPSADETSAEAGEAETTRDSDEAAPPADAEATASRGKKRKKKAKKGAATPEPEGEVLDEKARRRAEVQSFLGDKVYTPVGIPDGYQPSDRSIHPLFHVDLSALSFAGPLDLLLYLVRKHEMDILDVPIAQLTDRYLEMLDTFEALEIDVAAEFLMLASELTHIKSKMLLPADEGIPVETPMDTEEQGDPRAELIRRLLEYQKYRDAAEQLADRDQLGRDVFPRVPPPMSAVADLDPGLAPVNVFRLVELMAKLMREVPTHHEIAYESFSIAERIQYVSAFGEAHEGRFTVVALMSTMQSRSELVVTFIALLEMGKMGLARILSEPFHRAEAGPGLPLPAANEGDDTPEAPAPDEAEPPPMKPLEEEEAPRPIDPSDTEAIQAEAAAARAEAAALESMAAEVLSEQPVGEDAVDIPDGEPAPKEILEPLPEIWVELTDKRFQGDLVDDYK